MKQLSDWRLKLIETFCKIQGLTFTCMYETIDVVATG